MKLDSYLPEAIMLIVGNLSCLFLNHYLLGVELGKVLHFLMPTLTFVAYNCIFYIFWDKVKFQPSHMQ